MTIRLNTGAIRLFSTPRERYTIRTDQDVRLAPSADALTGGGGFLLQAADGPVTLEWHAPELWGRAVSAAANIEVAGL